MPSVERLTTTAGSEACEHTPLPRHARVNEPCRPMPECMMHLCGGASSIAAVRSSCAFRAALPASGTNRRCGRCVYGGECARHERRLSRVRDIKVLEGGTIRRGRRLRCHGAARAWRASEHEPGERQWAQRSDRPSMNAQGGTTSGSNESTAEGRTLRSGHRSVAVITL